MKKMILALLSVLGSYAFLSAQTAQVITSNKKGWHKIGETTVNFNVDHDQVLVMGADRFSAILFKVTDAPIDLINAQIYYEVGDMESIVLNSQVKAAGESSIFNIKGGDRSLKKITFTYKTLANYKDKKAHLEIWGFKADPDK